MKNLILKYKKIVVLLMALISTVAVYISLDKSIISDVLKSPDYIKTIIEFSRSFPKINIISFISFWIIYEYYNKSYFEGKKINIWVSMVSIIFSSILLIGYSFSNTNSLALLFDGSVQTIKTLIKFIGYYFLIYISIIKLFKYIPILTNKSFSENKVINFIFKKHPNICISLILMLVWLPLLIVYFPGMITYDAVTQIKQLYGMYQDFHINIINPNVALNNHHPVLSTLIMGGFVKFGECVLGNVSLGIYLYIIVQTLFLIFVINYSFKIFRKMNISPVIQLVFLIFYSFSPSFIMYTVAVGKDFIFAVLVLLYLLFVIEILIDDNVLKSKMYVFKLLITIFLIMMFRNNGVYNILLSMPFLIYFERNYRKELIVCLVLPLIVYMGINKIVYPMFEISSGSIKEMLSIPFQQTARTLSNGKEYSESDLEVINEVLNVDYITEHYDPTLSDAVKNTYNKKATKSQLLNYFRVWFKYLLKYPDVYIEATLNNIYGYVYPDALAREILFYNYPTTIKDLEFLNWKYLDTFSNERETLRQLLLLENKIPVIGTLISAGWHTWLMIILLIYVLFYKNRKEFLCVFIALLSILLVCIASPYFTMRYMLPIIYTIPALFAISIYVSKENVKKKKNRAKRI